MIVRQSRVDKRLERGVVKAFPPQQRVLRGVVRRVPLEQSLFQIRLHHGGLRRLASPKAQQNHRSAHCHIYLISFHRRHLLERFEHHLAQNYLGQNPLA